MGLIPWLLMLRLRSRQADRREGDTGKEQERRQKMMLDMAEKMRQQSDSLGRQRQYDPNQTVDQLFGM